MIWDKCLAKLSKSVSMQDFTIWISQLSVHEKNNSITVVAPNTTTASYINKNLKNTIIQSILEENSAARISFETVADESRQKLINTHLNKELSFDNLVEGNANTIAVRVGKNIAYNIKNTTYNPFIIYGESGLGKTHLMQSIGNLSLQLNPKMKVIYISLMDFVRNITAGIRHKNIEKIKNHYQNTQVLLIDDIHLIAGKSKSQEEFFHIFNFLFSNKRQIVMTCDKVPNDLNNIEKRLKTRMSGGFVAKVDVPEIEMRQAILLNKSQKQTFSLTEEAIVYISSNIVSNVRELEGALLKIKGFVEFGKNSKKIVDETMAKEILKDIIKTKRINVDIVEIQKETIKQYAVTTTELLSKSRKQNIVYARHTAIYLSQKLTNLPLSMIGKNFGNRDHSTIINSCERFKKLKEENPYIQRQYEAILTKLSTS